MDRGLDVKRIELSVTDYITLGFRMLPNMHLMYYCLVSAHAMVVFLSVSVCGSVNASLGASSSQNSVELV